ncbi:lipopolysaccharide transport periplasmic protein LptA [Polynucleobacter sp. AP-Capit-er-40B-B4]|uniref:lipopolysaccharide transport periplasmic protein LptA n=1 Tax=Polynucleobacter sp. AP-Capit-er-40B-B4 TaxID=2576927 RepID=UPI001C0D9F64|nr:lipopolysaccharide transport periplasmic protein LptA [Polynucleobacter sp. AP-Capit-er-40B-B4]MBU3581853.1 lipopolysaccharide transport periplasmic protein LptA [Polynucleobacter sp. AP-Capit-er-40B-B4]
MLIIHCWQTRILFACFALGLSMVNPVYAEKADQDKPVILEAEKVSVNDVKQIYDLNGQVLLIKGSIIVTGEDGHITVDPQGYEFVDVIGNPNKVASFRQRREGPADEFMQGRGAQVTYDAKTEFLTLTGDASLKRLLNMQIIDQLKGWKIEYDDVKQYYRVIPPQDAKPEDLPLARAILSPRRKATLEK